MMSMNLFSFQVVAKIITIYYPVLLVALSAAQEETIASSSSDNNNNNSVLPPDHPFLAPDSPWSIGQGSTYQLGSSSLPGPLGGDVVETSHLELRRGVPIVMSFSSPYKDDGKHVGWASLKGFKGAVVKVDVESSPMTIIDQYIAEEREENPPSYGFDISATYTFLNQDNHFFVTRKDSIEIFADDTDDPLSNRMSPIRLLSRSYIETCDDEDAIAGASVLYTGEIVLVTSKSGIVVWSPPTATTNDDAATVLSTNFDSCGTSTITNNPAVDETGGIYIVTSDQLVKYAYDDETKSVLFQWEVPYQTDDAQTQQQILVGKGSGSSPSLMGGLTSSPDDDDRFVVITDGQLPMNLVLVWRDGVPEDWNGLGDGRHERIACEVPVIYDDDSAGAGSGVSQESSSVSEQSVLVNGYAAIVVNNFLRKQRPVSGIKAIDANYAMLYGSDPDATTPGVQRIDWDPQSRTCEIKWTNNEVTVPNGIPTMSTETNLVYTISQKGGRWGLQSLDFDTGDGVQFWEVAEPNCTEEMIDFLSTSPLAMVSDYIKEYPQSCENSMYSATVVGPNSAVYTGTFVGLTKYEPSESPPAGTNSPDSSSSDGKRSHDMLGNFCKLSVLLLLWLLR